MTAIPVQHTWTVGEEVTSANLNLIPSGINWIYNQKPLCMVHAPSGSVTSVANQTWTAITMTTVDYDNMGGWAYGNSISDHYTAQMSGWYMVLGCIVWDSASSAASRAARITINGTTVAGIASHPPSIINTGVCMARTVYLAKLDYIQLQGFQDTGGSLNTAANYSNGAETCFFHLYFLGV